MIDAKTGRSLLANTSDNGTVDLSKTDALLNLQSNGTLRLAKGVQHIQNADGSHTFIVGLPPFNHTQEAVLSFDLLGFGLGADATASQVLIRDVGVSFDSIDPAPSRDPAPTPTLKVDDDHLSTKEDEAPLKFQTL